MIVACTSCLVSRRAISPRHRDTRSVAVGRILKGRGDLTYILVFERVPRRNVARGERILRSVIIILRTGVFEVWKEVKITSRVVGMVNLITCCRTFIGGVTWIQGIFVIERGTPVLFQKNSSHRWSGVMRETVIFELAMGDDSVQEIVVLIEREDETCWVLGAFIWRERISSPLVNRDRVVFLKSGLVQQRRWLITVRVIWGSWRYRWDGESYPWKREVSIVFVDFLYYFVDVSVLHRVEV